MNPDNQDYMLASPSYWKDYELIDTGGFEKLERYGRYVLARPEPQACWNKGLSEKEWLNMADIRYVRDFNKEQPVINEKGKWVLKAGIQEHWPVTYQYKEMKLHFELKLTAFKHIGLFPEQAENWNYIYDEIRAGTKKQKVLNLFAYTGGASLAAAAAGAEVVHVDSVKQVVGWARTNASQSGLDQIRWMVDDVVKFVKKEIHRGSGYNGIILDPPAYGRGPAGEKWVLEQNINELINLCAQLAGTDKCFVLISLYSMGYSALIAENLINKSMKQMKNIEKGELFFKDRFGMKLPLGTFLRTKKP